MSDRSARAVWQWLEDIITWGDRMAGYLSNVSQEEFRNRPLLQDAVVRCLECIGEASHQAIVVAGPDGLPEHIEFEQAYWARNRLSHGYYDIDVERVWTTATVSAPKLIAEVRELLAVRP